MSVPSGERFERRDQYRQRSTTTRGMTLKVAQAGERSNDASTIGGMHAVIQMQLSQANTRGGPQLAQRRQVLWIGGVPGLADVQHLQVGRIQ
jgi:head-tail adaptor